LCWFTLKFFIIKFIFISFIFIWFIFIGFILKVTINYFIFYLVDGMRDSSPDAGNYDSKECSPHG